MILHTRTYLYITKPKQRLKMHLKQTTQSLPAMDVDALYDDVMQCVYDDVDEGNGRQGEGDGPAPPPAIPVRKRNMSLIDLG